LLRLVLEAEGYRVGEAATGGEGLVAAAQRPPDVVLLDLGLPDLDGVEVLRRLREWSTVPVVVLSVRDREETKVAALDAGADDYVTKPFATPELLARLRAARRRAAGGTEPPVLVVGDGELEVDFGARRVRVRGAEVRLTPTEYQLLRVLARHVGRVVTHRQLLSEVWGPNVARQEPTQYLRVYVGHLREKLEADPGQPRWLLTEPGIGYRLVESPAENRFDRVSRRP
jgi:two-component system KDP operon response regulator KdpE